MLLTESPYRTSNILQYQVPLVRTVVSVDLGSRRDHSAIAVLEEREFRTTWDAVQFGYRWEKRILVRYLERLPLRTNYVDVAARVKEVADSVIYPKARAVVVDATGVGMPVVDLLKQSHLKAIVMPVIITGGDTTSRDGNLWRVPKKDIVSNIQILLEQHTLRLPGTIPEVEMLIKEMQDMRVVVSPAGNEKFGANREGEHDDLVLAVGLGAWWLCRAK